MKKADYCKLLIFSITILSCNKNNSQPEYYGTASMNVNGINWQADKVRCTVLNEFACYKNKIEIDLLKFSPEGYLRETYSFVKVLPSVSIQKIYPLNFSDVCNDTLHATYGTTIDHGDVGDLFYNTDTVGNNYLSIENYNAATKEISGSFSVTFVIVKEISTDITSADTIRVTNGKFSTKILN